MTPERCRGRAEECRKMALRTRDAEIRRALFELEAAFREAALDLERREPRSGRASSFG